MRNWTVRIVKQTKTKLEPKRKLVCKLAVVSSKARRGRKIKWGQIGRKGRFGRIEPNDSSNHIKQEMQTHTRTQKSDRKTFFAIFFSFFSFFFFGHRFMWYFLLAILSAAKYSVCYPQICTIFITVLHCMCVNFIFSSAFTRTVNATVCVYGENGTRNGMSNWEWCCSWCREKSMRDEA